jgi:glycosyltransferase involved in cell wall biosynthesis
MRILQVLPSLTAGGAEGFVTNLSVSMAGLGAEVCVFVMAGARRPRGQVLLERLHEANIDVLGIEERKPASLSNLIALTRLIRSWRPDIVQANLYAAEVASASTRVLLAGGKARYICRLANTDLCGYRSPRVVRMLDRFFHLIIANSPAVADAYIDFMGEKKRSKLVTIPNGGHILDSVPDAAEKQHWRGSLGIPSQTFVVTHIGRMFPGGEKLDGGLETGQKAQDILLRAFAKAFRGDPNCMLLLVGDGPLRPETERLAHSLELGKQARFLGEQPEPWPALKAADMFSLPSRYEGLPNALIEAASCGLPVVASDIPEIRNLSLGDAWLLAPVDDVSSFANAMLAVRTDLARFSSRACDVAPRFREKYSMKTCAEKYMRAYEQALGSSKKSEHGG